jgi:hypothetical protein
MPKRTTDDRPELKRINVSAAAIDIGSRMHMAAVTALICPCARSAHLHKISMI